MKEDFDLIVNKWYLLKAFSKMYNLLNINNLAINKSQIYPITLQYVTTNKTLQQISNKKKELFS